MTTPRPPRSDQMVSRLTPGVPAANAGGAPVRPGPPKFNIVISSFTDGAELLKLTEDDRGYLVVTGDESRWDEGAKLFLHQMMQWAGLVGIRWKDEARAAGEQ
jgi:hypothetical protein